MSGGGPRQSWHHNSRAKTHSRHNSTVLPRLGSNRMESYQNLHTHALDSAIQLQGNNRVLKRSPQYRTRSRDSVEDNDALSHNYGQDTAIYCRTTSIGYFPWLKYGNDSVLSPYFGDFVFSEASEACV